MIVPVIDQTIFLTLVQTPSQRAYARVLIDSIRTFGGELRHCPVWLFEADPQNVPDPYWESENVQIFPLDVPEAVGQYYFANKVFACAQAEQMAESGVRSLIWIDPECLIIKPPLLFDLGKSFDAAVRPVHIKNVGLLPTEPLDGFWQKIYEVMGVHDVPRTVETFVGGQQIRAYFNSHAFAINPAKGLLRLWFDRFAALVTDEAYQKAACQDVLHRVFLHQAVWSVLLVTALESERICILPADYNYPYNLHHTVPMDRRAAVLNELVCITYEDRTLAPDLVDDIELLEPLRAWLSDRFTL